VVPHRGTLVAYPQFFHPPNIPVAFARLRTPLPARFHSRFTHVLCLPHRLCLPTCLVVGSITFIPSGVLPTHRHSPYPITVYSVVTQYTFPLHTPPLLAPHTHTTPLPTPPLHCTVCALLYLPPPSYLPLPWPFIPHTFHPFVHATTRMHLWFWFTRFIAHLPLPHILPRSALPHGSSTFPV